MKQGIYGAKNFGIDPLKVWTFNEDHSPKIPCAINIPLHTAIPGIHNKHNDPHLEIVSS